MPKRRGGIPGDSQKLASLVQSLPPILYDEPAANVKLQ